METGGSQEGDEEMNNPQNEESEGERNAALGEGLPVILEEETIDLDDIAKIEEPLDLMLQRKIVKELKLLPKMTGV